jgi:hypothetical protein
MDKSSLVIVGDRPRVIVSIVLALFQAQVGLVPSLAREVVLMKFEHALELKVVAALEKVTITLSLLAPNLAATSVDL